MFKGRPMFPGRDKKVEHRARLRELLMNDSKDGVTQVDQPLTQATTGNKDRRVCLSNKLEYFFLKSLCAA